MSRHTRNVLFGMTIDYQLRYHDGLWSKLMGRGWNVHLASSPGKNLSQAASYGVDTHQLDMSRKPSPVKDVVGILRWIGLLRRAKPDVVVLGTPKAALLGLLAGKLCGVPVRIYEVHGLRLEGAEGLKQKVLSALERFTCSLATSIVPVSESLAAQIVRRKLADPLKLNVLGFGSPNGVDLKHFEESRVDQLAQSRLRDSLSIMANSPVITFVGRLNEDKGLRCLDQALRLLSGDLEAHLLIVGPVDDDAGHAALTSLAQAGVPVATTGEVVDVAPYLAISDVLCLPSKREGLPTVVLEAFACSVPVVGTRATGIVDLISHNETGGLVEIDDAKALAFEIERVLRDESLAGRYISNAHALVESRYSREEVQSKWTDYLDSFIVSSS